MSELEDKLNAILNDPSEMEKITRLASELMGGGAPEGAPAQAAPGADGELLGRITRLLGSAGGGDKTALLRALSPYLRPERQARLQKALRLARMARLAGSALAEDGGGLDV